MTLDWSIITTFLICLVGYYTRQTDRKIDRVRECNREQWKNLKTLGEDVSTMKADIRWLRKDHEENGGH